MGKKKIKPHKPGKISSDQSTPPPPSPEQMRPKFSFEYLTGDYCVTHCEKDDKAALVTRLHKLSTITWQEIKTMPRHGFGFEKISRNSLKATLPSQITDDITLIAFRFNGNKAMVGYRKNEVFYILIVDRNYTAYDHG